MQFFRYEAVTAKCRGLFGKMIKPSQYEDLLRCNSVAAIAEYLSDKTDYAEILHEINVSDVHRGQLEFSLNKQLFNEYVKLFTFTTGPERAFIGFMMTKYEFDYILEAFRSISSKHEQKFFNVPIFLTEHSHIDFTKLYAATCNEDIFEAIEHTGYRRIIDHLMDEDGGLTYTKIETALFENYYSNLYYKYTEGFDEHTRKLLRELIGVQADLINIMRIMRLKRNFDALPEDIIPMLIPVGAKLRPADIRALINIAAHDEMMSYIEGMYYGRKLPLGDYPTINEYMDNFLNRYYRKKMRVERNRFDIPFCYLYIKETEVKNLITIIEGVRYALPYDQIRRYLVGVGDEAEVG